jgi:hypothetical protein
MKKYRCESPFLPPMFQKIACHPDPASAGEGSSSYSRNLLKRCDERLAPKWGASKIYYW